MNIKQLNEVFSIYSDGRFKYADIDAKAVYDNCINKDFGVNITPETDEEQLRALRNTLVKYWADYVKEYKGDDWGRSRTKEESDKEWKMGDQMQFFTTVIDMAIDNLPEDKRISVKESIDNPYTVQELNSDAKYTIEVLNKNLELLSKEDEDFDKITGNMLGAAEDLVACLQDFRADMKELKDAKFESKNEEYEITNQDRIDAIREDERDLKNAINGVCNRFEAYSKNWDEEKQKMVQDRIMEIMETAETNLRNMIKRMK